ncbi:MAG: methionyl-tRNA formyltransferase [Bacillota bacterium]|nr:methionyl-tRNA formyltransferase [Bacillota bacterium]
MRVVFLGTPGFAVPSLEMLIKEGYAIAGVFTQPDRPKGRGMKDAPPPVKVLAAAYGLPVFQFLRIRDAEAQAALSSCKPDVMATVAFGQILSKENLDTAPLGCINVHASLLPRYRGPAPIQWAIINGEEKTGITTMFMDTGVDTGDIILQRETPIGPGETGGELYARLSVMGAEVLRETLRLIAKGSAPRVKQDERTATQCPMMDKSTGKIDWKAGRERIRDMVRACDPWPGAFAVYDSRILKIWKVAAAAGPEFDALAAKPGDILFASEKKGLIAMAGDGALEVLELQAAGGRRMNAREYLRGNPMAGVLRFEETVR